MSAYADYWFPSHDGLKLYARDYRCVGAEAGTIICIPGLTRNSADFAVLAEHLSKHYRVVAVDLRGRGRSDNDPKPENYVPEVYCADVLNLLDRIDAPEVTLIGTSLGGLVSILCGARERGNVRSIILNDIGPEVQAAGLQRIQSYMRTRVDVVSWPEAIAQTQETLGNEYPLFQAADWKRITGNLYREDEAGRPVLNYDRNIGASTDESADVAAPPDLWSSFAAISGIPLLVVRGETSDILSLDTVEKMQRIHPHMALVEVPSCGHAPELTEPESLQAIGEFLATPVDDVA